MNNFIPPQKRYPIYTLPVITELPYESFNTLMALVLKSGYLKNLFIQDELQRNPGYPQKSLESRAILFESWKNFLFLVTKYLRCDVLQSNASTQIRFIESIGMDMFQQEPYNAVAIMNFIAGDIYFKVHIENNIKGILYVGPGSTPKPPSNKPMGNAQSIQNQTIAVNDAVFKVRETA